MTAHPCCACAQSLQERQYTRLQLGAKLDELWKQVRSTMQGYAEATEQQSVAFEALKQKDEKSSREVETQMKRLQKLQVAAGRRGGRGGTGDPIPNLMAPFLTSPLSPGLNHSHQEPTRGSSPGEPGAEPAHAGREGEGP